MERRVPVRRDAVVLGAVERLLVLHAPQELLWPRQGGDGPHALPQQGARKVLRAGEAQQRGHLGGEKNQGRTGFGVYGGHRAARRRRRGVARAGECETEQDS